MNKLMGFMELKESGLPSVPWRIFNESVELDDNYLWTVRTAIKSGDDLNLPRIVGKVAEEAYNGALEIYNRYKDRGMVIYYPYFIAEKSGTLEIKKSQVVIEAVEKDLWNMVTYNKINVSIEIKDGIVNKTGEADFLSDSEIDEFMKYAEKIKSIFRSYTAQEKTLLLEWSYAFNTDTSQNPIGDRYLVFYEIREV